MASRDGTRAAVGDKPPDPSRVAAVMTPDGDVVHAEAGAAARDARERLRALVRDLERARAAIRRADSEEALVDFRPEIAGRWTLLDRFESDGRRYVLAGERSPDVKRMSAREAEIVGLAATGMTNKEIAYALDLAHATVRVVLHRVAAKAGVRTRHELVALARALGRGERR